MSEKRMTKCDACGEQIDYNNGSVALMMAFCCRTETSLTNVAYCKQCYENLVKKHLIDLKNATGTNFGNFE